MPMNVYLLILIVRYFLIAVTLATAYLTLEKQCATRSLDKIVHFALTGGSLEDGPLL